MKVKMISSIFEETLEERINEFIKEIRKDHKEIKNIKYSTVLLPSGNVKHCALIMYGWDGQLRITSIKGVEESI